ncbi:MAG: DUF3887 domain-containing protein [Chloroflexi bacterium]|nr:MAG: DUF3887 domain-containing protein [Chloroflexota bacterium]
MKKTNTKISLFICTAAIISIVLMGCSGLQAKPSALSNEEVTAATEELLIAIEEDDYEAFTPDMSETLLEAFTQTEFQEMKTMLSETSGNLVSCSDPALLNQEEYAVYRVPCEFEKEDVTVTMVYEIGGNELDGLFFDSPGLRAYSNE